MFRPRRCSASSARSRSTARRRGSRCGDRTSPARGGRGAASRHRDARPRGHHPEDAARELVRDFASNATRQPRRVPSTSLGFAGHRRRRPFERPISLETGKTRCARRTAGTENARRLHVQRKSIIPYKYNYPCSLSLKKRRYKSMDSILLRHRQKCKVVLNRLDHDYIHCRRKRLPIPRLLWQP